MIAGSIVGGYSGAALARTIDPRWIRVLVIVIGWTMTDLLLRSVTGESADSRISDCRFME